MNELNDVIRHVEKNMVLAEEFFRELEAKTGDEKGICRESYGEGEDIAHELLRSIAVELGLEVSIDIADNTYVRLIGSDMDAPVLITGSHLDSQSHAGNYDGAAGVVAGLVALTSIKEAEVMPPQDIVLMAFRAEEAGNWFKGRNGGKFGSRAALGKLWPGELENAIHIGDGLSLSQLIDLRLDHVAIENILPRLKPGGIKSFIELHIEQGPILTSKGFPVGIVTGIRGTIRATKATCIGKYDHSGGVPHEYRHDAVTATAEFVYQMDQKRRDVTSKGSDMVYSTGKFYTNLEIHAHSKVAGETFFTVDVRSLEQEVIDSMGKYMRQLEKKIGTRHNVELNLGEFSRTTPTFMDPTIRESLHRGCVELGIPRMDILSGGGHDATEFCLSGVPTAMIFIRNEGGSHNPEESIDMNDFKLCTSLLSRTLLAA